MVYICPSVLFSGHHFELSSYKSFRLSLCSSNTGILLFLELTTYVPTSETFIWIAVSFYQGLRSTVLLSLYFVTFFHGIYYYLKLFHALIHFLPIGCLYHSRMLRFYPVCHHMSKTWNSAWNIEDFQYLVVEGKMKGMKERKEGKQYQLS